MSEPDEEPNTVLDKPAPAQAPAEPKTVADKPSAREEATPRPSGSITTAPSLTGRSTAGSEPGRSTVVASPLDAMKRAEILATRNFARVGLLIVVGALATIPLLPGHPISTYVFMGSIGIGALALIYLYRRTSDPATYYDGPGVAIGWYLPAAACSAAVPFFGPFSPVPIVLVMGVFFTSSGASFRLSLALYLTCAIVQGTTGILVIAGIADPGFIRADYLPLYVQIICQALVQLVLLATFLIARGSRRSSLVALGELEQAVRAIAQREALLEEAREELRRAVGTGRGRFTDQQIGHWHLGDVIGRGAMGEVYEAVDAGGQSVAIKMLSQASLSNMQHVQRFLRELRTAAAIDSPNVVRVIEIGEQPLPHLVMERLRGKDLATILRGKAKLSEAKIIDMLRQVGAGITAAGAAGIIHRDLKPQNVFLAGVTWKVLDFGVARATDTGDTLTSGQVVGTPAYMAPEQARGAAVDHKTDLYALAGIAYRALTGHAPFSGGEIADLLYRVVHTPPRRPTSLAKLAPDVDLVLAIGLAKDSTLRFATAKELVDAIASALASQLSPTLRTRAEVIKDAWLVTKTG
jgi:serine/threonine-protein kinase